MTNAIKTKAVKAKAKAKATKVDAKTERASKLNDAVSAFFDAEALASTASKAAAAFYRASKITNKDAEHYFCDVETSGAKKVSKAIDELKSAIFERGEADKKEYDRSRPAKAAKDALAVMLTGKTNIARQYDLKASKKAGAFVVKAKEARAAQAPKGGVTPNAVMAANSDGANSVKEKADASIVAIERVKRDIQDLAALVSALTDASTKKLMNDKIDAIRKGVTNLA